MTSNEQLFQQLCDKHNLKIHKTISASYAQFKFPDNMIKETWGSLLKLRQNFIMIAGELHYNKSILHYSQWQKFSNKHLSKLLSKRENLIKQFKQKQLQKKLKDIENDFQ